MSQFAVAPAAPGSIGADVPPEQLMRFLEDLGRWRDLRKGELDVLDQAALSAPDRDSLTGDVLLSMTLWKAVADRHDLLLAAWDSGRLDAAGRQHLTTLIWGRLDQSPGSALAVSLAEACRLSDSLAVSLRSRLRLEGSEPDVANRLQDLRAQLERIRDQVALVPSAHRSSGQAALAELGSRLDEVTERARRGADVGGLLGPLEAAAATAERDLIVAASARDRARGDHALAQRRRAELVAEGQAVRALAERARTQVRAAPRLGIPDVTALGEVPTGPQELTAYLARLDLVGKALAQAQTAYAAALTGRQDTERRLAELATRVEIADRETTDDLADLLRRAHAALDSVPVDLDRAQALMAAVEAYLGRRIAR